MAKVKHRSLYELPDLISKKTLPPVIFFCGEDAFAIDAAVKKVSEALEPEIGSDFDKETISVEKKAPIQQMLDVALSFPFGGDKKMLIVKEFSNFDDKPAFAAYVKNPAEFTYLICIQHGNINSVRNEPYKSLHEHKYIFEARKLKPEELVEWLMKNAKRKNIKLSYDNAASLVEIVGDEKSLLETTMQKLFDNVGEGGEITFEGIRDLASSTRMYTTFNLIDEIGRGNKTKALEIAYNLLDSGTHISQIITMLTNFCVMNAQSIELKKKDLPLDKAAKEAEVNFFYYKNSTLSNIYDSKNRLMKAASALYKADLAIKTTSTDPKTIITILISEMISN